MYGSENWDLNRSERRKIETTEMLVFGCTFTDHVRNKIRDEFTNIYVLGERI
jgi:hypothetical protein